MKLKTCYENPTKILNIKIPGVQWQICIIYLFLNKLEPYVEMG